MIADLFWKNRCKCGNEDRYKFIRLKSLRVKRGTDWLCKCNICGGQFRIEWERQGGYDG